MIDWESVKISTLELRGSVEMADRTAMSSALYDDGQSVILAEKLLITWLLRICILPTPIEQLLVPISDTDPSV